VNATPSLGLFYVLRSMSGDGLRSKMPRVRIKVALLLLTVLSVVGCASNSTNTEGKGVLSGMPKVTVDAPKKEVKATINF